MQLRVNAIIAYKKGGWSSYTSVYDETTRTASQEFPSKDSAEGNEFLSWPGVKEKLSIVSLPSTVDVSHISDITYNISSIGDAKTDIYSANEDVVVGSLGDGTKHDDLAGYVEQHHLTNSLRDLDYLFFCWDFSGPDGPLVPLDNDDDDGYGIPNYSRTGIKEINNRNGFLSAVSVAKVNNKLRFAESGDAWIIAPFFAKQINLRKYNIAKGVGFTARIDVLAMDGAGIKIGIGVEEESHPLNVLDKHYYPMWVYLDHDADTLDYVYSSGSQGSHPGGIVSGSDIAIPGGFPSIYKLNMAWALNGDLTIAIDDTIIYNTNTGECWVALNTVMHWTVNVADGESIDLDKVMLIDTDSVAELNSLTECPTKCSWHTSLPANAQPQCVARGPLTPPVPKLQLIISGLGEGFTFLGFGNGVHQVTPGHVNHDVAEGMYYLRDMEYGHGGQIFLSVGVAPSSWPAGGWDESSEYYGFSSAFGLFWEDLSNTWVFIKARYGEHPEGGGGVAYTTVTSGVQSHNIPRVPMTFDGTFKMFGSVTFTNGVTISWQKGTDWF